MKKIVLIVFLIVCFLQAHNEEKIQTKIVLTNKEKSFINDTTVKVIMGRPWEPFFINENGNLTGLSFDFLQLVKEKTGLKTQEIQVDTFSNVLKGIKDKVYDIALSTGETKDRKSYASFSKSYANFSISIATSKDVHFIEDIDILKDKKIAIGKDFTAYKLMLKKYPNFKYVLVDDVKEGLELVSENQVFAFIDIMPVLTYSINKYGYTNIKISGNTGLNYALSFMIRDDYPELLTISNKVINSLTIEEKQSILNRWIAVVYDKSFNYELFLEVLIVFIIILTVVAYKNRQLLKYQDEINDKNRVLEEQKNRLVKTNMLLEQTQTELNSSLKSFKTLVDSTIEAIIIVVNKKVIYCNEAFIEIFEYENEAQVYRTDVDEYFFDDIFDKKFNSTAHELYGRKKDKRKFPILLKKAYLKEDSNEKLVISIFDLTELKSREAMIQEQAKMASMGEMIGNIAHQWRQPLSTITTVASGLKLHKELGIFTDELLDEAVGAIIKNGQFLSQTIDDFRDYLKDTKNKENFDLTKLINQSLNLVRPSYKNNFIRVVMQINHPIYITSYFNELNQAIINILNNAKDALIESQEEDKYVFINFFVQENEVVIEISDNAGGINENIMKSIYDPYFTTKHKSQGTGLGLYMTYKIITESLNGTINSENIFYRYNNKDYTGANFTIRLPLS